MRVIDADRIEAALGWSALIETPAGRLRGRHGLRFAGQVLEIEGAGGEGTSLLITPAWEAGTAIGIKVVTFFPGNAARGKATINAGYLLFDGADGRMQALLEEAPSLLTGARARSRPALPADAAGVIAADRTAADLFESCRGSHPGRRHKTERTIFKSVGLAPEDLTATRLALATEAGGA